MGLVSAQIGFDNPNLPTVESITSTINSFLGLSDTPATFAGAGSYCVMVNAGATAIEFKSCNVTGGGTGVEDTNATTECGNTEVLLGNGTCMDNTLFFDNTDTITTDTNASTECSTDEVLLGNSSCMSSSLFGTGGGFDGNASSICSNAEVLLGNNSCMNSALFFDNTDTTIADTNATTECSGDEVLLGNGSCQTSSGFGGAGDTNNDGLFVNYTLVKTTGNISINASYIGYAGADRRCHEEISGSHMCQMFEMINSHRIKGIANFTATFRVSEGAPGFTTNANDCIGWRDETGTFLGSIWVGNNNDGGQGALVACDASRAIGCCLWEN